MVIMSTSEFQSVDEAVDFIGDVCTDLNVAEDAIQEGDYPAAQLTISAQIDNLKSLLEWVNQQMGGTGDEE